MIAFKKSDRSRSASCSALPSYRNTSPSPHSSNTNLLQGLYKGNIMVRTVSHKGITIHIPSSISRKQKPAPAPVKPLEEVQQENLHLKTELNKLRQEVAILKGRLSANKKAGNGMGMSEVEIDYHRDIYWSNNPMNLRVEGVKQQYDKLKNKYHDQEQQIQQLKKKIANRGTPELEVYVKELEDENYRLRNMLLQPSLRKDPSSLPNRAPWSTPTPCQHMQQINRKNKQIEFLQKSLIAQGNSAHSLGCRLRKLQKANNSLHEQNTQLRNQLHQDALRVQLVKLKVVAAYQRELDQINGEYQATLQIKQARIKQLERELTNLEVLAGAGDKEKERSKIYNSSQCRIYNTPSRTRRSSHDIAGLKLNIKEEKEKQQNKQGQTSSRKYDIDQNFNIIDGNESNGSSIPNKNPVKRQPRQANHKYDDHAIKAKKVEFPDVREIGQILRYRMIANKVQISDIPEYFSWKQPNKSNSSSNILNTLQQLSSSSSSRSMTSWSQTYITMRQCQQTLSNPPFCLGEPHSVTLSRYMVEDSDDAIQYIAAYNETRREIVKSIIKTLIGSYQLPSQAELQKYWYMIDKYGGNIGIMLDSNDSQLNGKVDRKKFIEVAVRVGAEPTEIGKEILIARASLYSVSFAQLDYRKVLQQSQPK